MKALLVRAVMVAGVMLGVVGCNNSTGGTVGIPTIQLNVDPDPQYRLRITSTAPYVLSGRLAVYSLPGSPSGSLRTLETVSGDSLGVALYVPECPIPTQPGTPNCGPYYMYISKDYGNTAPTRDQLTATAYVVEGNNAIAQKVRLGVPQPLVP
jgi:hypothetical protein